MFGRQNRGVKSHFFSGPPGQKTVLLHRHCIANQGFTGNDEYLLDQRLDEGPTLGQFTLLSGSFNCPSKDSTMAAATPNTTLPHRGNHECCPGHFAIRMDN